MAEGFLALSGVTGEPEWVALAGELLDSVLTSFGDGDGGFYDTAAGAEQLIFRPADPADNATPSGTFAAAGALLSYAALTGSARHREAALAALGVLPVLAGRYPRAAGAGLAIAEAVLAGPAEIAIVGPPGGGIPANCTGPPCWPHRRRRARAGQRDGCPVPLLAGRGWSTGRRRIRLPPLHLPAARDGPGGAPCRAGSARIPVIRMPQLRSAPAA